MRNIDLIDDYLADRMSDAERNAFEQRLASDTELNREFNFHKDIVSSIKEVRKAELKSMLNSIPVGGSTGTFGTSLKVAGALVAATITIGGFYLLLQDDKPEIEQQTVIEQPAETRENDFSPEVIEEEAAPETPREEKQEVAAEQEQKETVDPSATPRKLTPAEIQTPNLVDDFDSEGEAKEITEPPVFTETDDFTAETLFDSNIEVVTDESKRRYQFHYQMKNDKLYLFGAFDKDLYEILEFNNAQGKTVILYYKDNYYLINNEQEEITPLKPIEDENLVNKLDKLR